MKEIVFASFNLKKAEEIQRIAKDKVKVICLKDIKDLNSKKSKKCLFL